MRKLMVISDAACASGFERAIRYPLDVLRRSWDVYVLGLNYHGDPHEFPYKIYPACTDGRDWMGVRRTAELFEMVSPDAVLIQQDPWNFPAYFRELAPIITKQDRQVPVIGAVAVDGKNCRGTNLNGLSQAIFWTKFGEQEARAGGYTGRSAIVPLGVDLDIYKPMDRRKARQMIGLPPRLWDKFIIGNVNRNQPRKRLDLTISFFAEWVKTHEIDDAYLYLHVCPTGEFGYDVKQLMKYYGFSGDRTRLILAEPEVGQGVPENELVLAMNTFDVGVTTTQGEGWGLPTLEMMACGIPQIVPKWSALEEWATAAVQVPCSEMACTINMINVIGGVPDRQQFIKALDDLYRSETMRAERRAAGLALAAQPGFRWENIGQAFAEAVELALPVSEGVLA